MADALSVLAVDADCGTKPEQVSVRLGIACN